MTDNLKNLLSFLSQSDPYQIVKCDMDGFSPYTYLELPPSWTEIIKQLDKHEYQIWEEVENDYLFWIQDGLTVVHEHIQELITSVTRDG